LVAVVVATAIAAALRVPIQYVSIPDNLFQSLNIVSFDEVGLLSTPGFWGAVLGFAVIASAETLLCATAVDRMHDGERTDYDRELLAQGVGNTLCGFLGALPMTGVIVRSSANVEAGAKTRNSAIFHGLWLLAFVLMIPFVIRWIPTSALAAILVYTGYKLVNPAAIKKLWLAGRSEVFIYAATVVAIVVFNLLAGVMLGIGLALAKLFYAFVRLEIRAEVSDEQARVDISLHGAATFVQLPKIVEVLESIREDLDVKFHLGGLTYTDRGISSGKVTK